jgi:hypothetical protein
MKRLEPSTACRKDHNIAEARASKSLQRILIMTRLDPPHYYNQNEEEA